MSKSYMVLGATGMLGQALMNELKSRRNHMVRGVARQSADIELDITDEEKLIQEINAYNPDVIINAAAIVNLTFCEEHPDQCYRTNAKPSTALARHCALNNIKYVYISTDHYYSGDQDQKHSEQDPLKLCNQYAISKQLGEEFSLLDENALVVRTNIVGFRGDEDAPTFVEWVISALKKNEQMQLFNDFYTSSIDVMSFCGLLIDLIEQNCSGIINLASCEVSSKEQFISALAKRLNLSMANAEVCSMKQFDLGIDRNESLGLDVSRAEKMLNRTMPDMNDVIENIASEYLGNEKK